MNPHTTTIDPSVLPDLREQAEQTIAEARRRGVSVCEVAASLEQDLSTSVRQGEVETIEFNRDQGFGTIPCTGQRKGSASASATGEATIRKTVVAMLAAIRHASEDKCAGLAGVALMARELPELDLYHPQSLSPEQAVERVLVCEAAVFTASKRVIKTDGTTLSTHQGCRVYDNGHGFIGDYANARYSLSRTMIAEGEGQIQRNYWYSVNRRGEASTSAESIGRRAAERAASRLGVRPAQIAEMSVLFTSEIVVGLFGRFLGTISGGSLYRKSSFLEGALGQRLSPEWLSIDERPHLVGVLGNASFDSDGLATYAKPFIENDELVSYVLGAYSGRKFGLPGTANTGGVHNLFVNHGDEDQAVLIRRMGRGLLVTELMRQGVNLVTGDYSRGTASYWVESGGIQFPAQEVTVAANLYDLFHHIVVVGKDIKRHGNLHASSVLVESMMVTGR